MSVTLVPSASAARTSATLWPVKSAMTSSSVASSNRGPKPTSPGKPSCTRSINCPRAPCSAAMRLAMKVSTASSTVASLAAMTALNDWPSANASRTSSAVRPVTSATASIMPPASPRWRPGPIPGPNLRPIGPAPGGTTSLSSASGVGVVGSWATTAPAKTVPTISKPASATKNERCFRMLFPP